MTRVLGTCLTYDVPRVDHRVHGYRTIIRPGALAECLARRTIAVWLNHREPTRPIASQRDGTLTFVDTRSE